MVVSGGMRNGDGGGEMRERWGDGEYGGYKMCPDGRWESGLGDDAEGPIESFGSRSDADLGCTVIS